MVTGEHRLPEAGGAAAIELAADVGVGFPAGETFLGQHDLASRGVGGFTQDFCVSPESRDGNQEHVAQAKSSRAV